MTAIPEHIAITTLEPALKIARSWYKIRQARLAYWAGIGHTLCAHHHNKLGIHVPCSLESISYLPKCLEREVARHPTVCATIAELRRSDVCELPEVASAWAVVNLVIDNIQIEEVCSKSSVALPLSNNQVYAMNDLSVKLDRAP